MREMGQSAWLSTSLFTLQGSEERVNEGSQVYLVGLVCLVHPVDVVQRITRVRPNRPDRPNEQDRLAVRRLESASQSEPPPHRQDLG